MRAAIIPLGRAIAQRLKRPYPRFNERAALPSYLVLLRVGFSMRARLLVRRWALTPPFHPYPRGRYVFCATFRGSPRAAVSGHPALWSPDFPPLAGRSPDSLRQTRY